MKKLLVFLLFLIIFLPVATKSGKWVSCCDSGCNYDFGDTLVVSGKTYYCCYVANGWKSSPECHDIPDGGDEPLIYAVSKDCKGEYDEVCLSETSLKEYYCSNGFSTYKSVNCGSFCESKGYGDNGKCSGGKCVCCWNDCSPSGFEEYQCVGSSVQKRVCGDYDSDPCLEWSSWTTVKNCNDEDGCYGSFYRNYYCSNGACTYSEDDCSDCSCSCGGYNVEESPANNNCNDGKDNDCDGLMDSKDPNCPSDECNSNADCDDNNPCTTDWCEDPASSNSKCHHQNVADGTDCGDCKECQNGECVYLCEGTESSCECINDVCIDCSDYYGTDCGYGSCNADEKPSWDCSDIGCTYTCYFDTSCKAPDTTPPTTSINPNGIDWTNQDVSFTLSCSDDDSGCSQTKYSIIDSSQSCPSSYDNLANTGTSGTVSCSSGSSCVKVVCYASKDNAGNFENVKRSNEFKIDKAVPSGDISHSPLSPTDQDTVTYSVSAQDTDSGLDEIRIYVDDGLKESCDFNGETTQQTCTHQEGPYPSGTTHSYYAVIYDIAGNSYTTPTDSFTVTSGCVRANPSVTIIPSSQSGNAGDTLTYTVEVTNNDNSACGSSTFSLSVTQCPSGFTCTLTLDSLTIDPGTTSSTSISVTSSSSSTAGTYTFEVKATNDADSNYFGEGSADYTVLTQEICCPHITITSPSSVSEGDEFSVTLSFSHDKNDDVGIHLRWKSNYFDYVSASGCNPSHYDEPSFASGWEGIECSYLSTPGSVTITLRAVQDGTTSLYYRAWDSTKDADCGGYQDHHRDPSSGTCSSNCDSFPDDWEVCNAKSKSITINPGTPPPPPEDCDNGVDDDGDGYVDCEDTDCISDPNCQTECCDIAQQNGNVGYVPNDNKCPSGQWVCLADNVRAYQDWYCKNDCSCDYTYKNQYDCDNDDDWYNIGPSYACCKPGTEEKCTCQDQEYRDYYCDDSTATCKYTVTDTRTVYKESTCYDCNKLDCTDGLYCVGEYTSSLTKYGNDYTCSNGACKTFGDKLCGVTMENKKLRWCFKIKDGSKIVEPNERLSKSYLEQAKSSLLRANKDFQDKDLLWTTVAIYYAEYYALYSFLQRIGVKCGNHSCSIIVVGILLGEDKIENISENEEVKIYLGKAFDVLIERILVSYKKEKYRERD